MACFRRFGYKLWMICGKKCKGKSDLRVLMNEIKRTWQIEENHSWPVEKIIRNSGLWITGVFL